MEELTIEQKAKRYDEALERASKLRVQNPFDTVSQMMEHVFPELKESEDERIRKDIISFVEQAIDSGYGIIRKERKEKWISWLEKQSKQSISHDDEIMIEQLTEYFTTGHGLQNTNETVIAWLNDVKRKLEKQGEKKSAEEYNITGIVSKKAQGKLGEMIKNLESVNNALKDK